MGAAFSWHEQTARDEPLGGLRAFPGQKSSRDWQFPPESVTIPPRTILREKKSDHGAYDSSISTNRYTEPYGVSVQRVRLRLPDCGQVELGP